MPYTNVKLPTNIVTLPVKGLTTTPQTNIAQGGPRITRTSYHLSFTDDRLDIPSASALTGLLNANAFTLEMSVALSALPAPYYQGFLFSCAGSSYLNGMYIGYYKYGGLNYFTVEISMFNGTDYAAAEFQTDIDDDVVRHIEADVDMLGQTIQFFVNGVEISQASYNWDAGIVPTAIGTKDAVFFNEIAGYGGADNYLMNGALYWFMASNVAKHSSNFTPPDLNICPAADGNTVARLAIEEGSGAATADSVSGENGTITGAEWSSGPGVRVTRGGNTRVTRYQITSYPELVGVKLNNGLINLPVEGSSRGLGRRTK